MSNTTDVEPSPPVDIIESWRPWLLSIRVDTFFGDQPLSPNWCKPVFRNVTYIELINVHDPEEIKGITSLQQLTHFAFDVDPYYPEELPDVILYILNHRDSLQVVIAHRLAYDLDGRITEFGVGHQVAFDIRLVTLCMIEEESWRKSLLTEEGSYWAKAEAIVQRRRETK